MRFKVWLFLMIVITTPIFAMDPPEAKKREIFALFRKSSPLVLEKIKTLIAGNYSLNFPDEGGMTPLMLACVSGNIEAVTQLLEGMADVDLRAQDGWTALQFAVNEQLINVIQILLRAGADVNIPSKIFCATALYSACVWKNNIAVIQALLDAGADRTMVWGGQTPAELAQRHGYPKAVQLLTKTVKLA